jgi:hypothetical protein
VVLRVVTMELINDFKDVAEIKEDTCGRIFPVIISINPSQANSCNIVINC